MFETNKTGKQPVVLSIAGSDNSGGAGIQADIKTCCALCVYAATTITAVTSQNSNHVYAVDVCSLNIIESQIDSIMETIRPDAVKIGMLPTPEIIRMIAGKLKYYKLNNIVVDPVMVATNGDSLIKGGSKTIDAIIDYLFPLATIVTPNIPEAETLIGSASLNIKDTCEKLVKDCNMSAVLLKGGHCEDEKATDLLFDGKEFTTFSQPRIKSINTHGTGCTLSSAIACGLAKKQTLKQAVANAKDFIFNAIRYAEDINVTKGPGPLNFLWYK
ncbi:MAG: bifunctional hydroxymethylpyrimidine kinase/phosphomethylpyrimidine kinase [Roseburia sp.]|nr:bifunctional hydroxymethylpyrimidine kinase/phosphomethylpyrimidine kinase [Roseburia sp.]